MATAAEINALYDEMLGRAPGNTAVEYWLSTGDSLDKIKSDIAMSPEYASYQQSLQTPTTPGTTTPGTTTPGTTTPTTSNPTAAQITSIYTTMLGRAPDANGLEYWLNSGEPLTSIAGNIALSDEYQQRLNELSTISAADQLKKFNMLKQAQQYSDILKGQNQDTTRGQSFLPDMADTMALPESLPFYGAQSPVELFQNAMANTMPTAATNFNMPTLTSVPDWTRANVPTNNLFTDRSRQEDSYGAMTKKPSMFAEGGFVNQPFQQNMFEYPTYGAMSQDVFNFSAPVVSQQGQLMQLEPGGILSPMPGMPSPIVQPEVPGGVTTLPVLNPLEQEQYLKQAENIVQEDPRIAYQNQITGLYDTLLNRTPDQQGLDYWTTKAQQGMSMEDIRRNIEASAEAQTKQGIGSLTTDQGSSTTETPVPAPVPVPKELTLDMYRDYMGTEYGNAYYQNLRNAQRLQAEGRRPEIVEQQLAEARRLSQLMDKGEYDSGSWYAGGDGGDDGGDGE